MQRLDVSGLIRPAPIRQIRRALAALAAGERLEVAGDDPALIEDVPAFCMQAGHALIMAREQENGGLVFLIARGSADASDPAGSAVAAHQDG